MYNIDVKILAKLTYSFFNEWQITAVEFELNSTQFKIDYDR